MSECIIRHAAASDAAALAAIYNHYVTTSTATFDTTGTDAAHRARWLAARAPEHPVLVAEDGGRVVGFGALSRWAERAAWGRTVEISVYVAAGERGAGVGPRLTQALVEAARAAGHHAVVAQIVAGNEASLKMAERAGFTRVGVLREVGYKFEQWLDVVLMELIVGE